MGELELVAVLNSIDIIGLVDNINFIHTLKKEES